MAELISIPRGDEVIEALRAATSGSDAWVQASGAVEAVELRVAGDGVDPTRALRGRLTLVALAGPAGGPYSATLARATDVGLEVLAGELMRARSDGVTAFVTRVTNVIAAAPERERSAPRASPGPLKPPSAWASQAMASAASAAGDDAEPDPVLPVPGDLVQHFAFGLCEVLTGDDERLKIRDVSGPGRIREIRLDMLDIRGPSDKDGKRLFRLERRS